MEKPRGQHSTHLLKTGVDRTADLGLHGLRGAFTEKGTLGANIFGGPSEVVN